MPYMEFTDNFLCSKADASTCHDMTEDGGDLEDRSFVVVSDELDSPTSQFAFAIQKQSEATVCGISSRLSGGAGIAALPAAHT